MRSTQIVPAAQVRTRSFARLLVAAGCVVWSWTVVLPAAEADGVLWTNGDPRSRSGGVANTYSTTSSQYSLFAFDDFQVTDALGWGISGLWVFDDLLTGITVTHAWWEIREGMSANSPGTVVSSGLSPVTATFVRPSNLLGYDKYNLELSGLDFELGPGTYWLAVVPLVPANPTVGLNPSYASETDGANAVGTPGINSNALLLLLRNNSILATDRNLALGIAGSVIPEPTTFALLGLGSLALVMARRRR